MQEALTQLQANVQQLSTTGQWLLLAVVVVMLSLTLISWVRVRYE